MQNNYSVNKFMTINTRLPQQTQQNELNYFNQSVDILHVVCMEDMSGLLFENNKHTIAKVRENANRHGGKNVTITK